MAARRWRRSSRPPSPSRSCSAVARRRWRRRRDRRGPDRRGRRSRSAVGPPASRSAPSASGSRRAAPTQVDGVAQGSGDLDFRVEVPSPIAVAVGFDSVWAVSQRTDSLYRLDPLEGTEPVVIPLGDGADPSDVAAGGRWVWVAEAGRPGGRADRPADQRPGGDRAPGHRAALDRDRRRRGLGDQHPRRLGLAHRSRRAAAGRELDRGRRAPQRHRRRRGRRVGDEQPQRNRDRSSTPRSGDVVGDPIAVGSLPRGIAAGNRYVWVALGGDDSVVRIDPEHPQPDRRADRGRRRPLRRGARRATRPGP